MNRFSVALFAVVLWCGVGYAAKQPNFIFLMADDLDSSYKQDHLAIMKRLRADIVEQGVTMLNHVAAHPVCGPSRSSLLAGRYPHNTNYRNNRDKASVDAWEKQMNNTFGTWLTDAGYHTAMIGKYVNGMDNFVFDGWNKVSTFTDGSTYTFYNSTVWNNTFVDGRTLEGGLGKANFEGIHQADFMGKLALDEVQKALSADKPFMIHITPTMVHWGQCLGPCPVDNPHCRNYTDPYYEFIITDPYKKYEVHFPSSPCPTHRHAQVFADLELVKTPAWNVTAEPHPLPAFMAKYPELDPWVEYRETLAFRNRSSSMLDLDDLLGSLLDGLKALGQDVYDDTVFIVTSDNGYHLGEHREPFGKGTPYTTDVSLPLYVKGPGFASNVVRYHPTTHMDLTATVVELAGATPVGPPLDGQSFVQALGGDPIPVSEWRTWSYSEFWGLNNTWGALRFVNATEVDAMGDGPLPPGPRLPTVSRAIHRWCTNDTEVFETATDPWQLANTGGATPTPEGEELLRKYEPMLAALTACSGESCRKPKADGVQPLKCYIPVTKKKKKQGGLSSGNNPVVDDL